MSLYYIKGQEDSAESYSDLWWQVKSAKGEGEIKTLIQSFRDQPSHHLEVNCIIEALIDGALVEFAKIVEEHQEIL